MIIKAHPKTYVRVADGPIHRVVHINTEALNVVSLKCSVDLEVAGATIAKRPQSGSLCSGCFGAPEGS